MSEQNEEEARRRKIIEDSSVIDMASQNIRAALAGDLTVGQLDELTEIDREYLRKTRECLNGRSGRLPDSPDAA